MAGGCGTGLMGGLCVANANSPALSGTCGIRLRRASSEATGRSRYCRTTLEKWRPNYCWSRNQDGRSGKAAMANAEPHTMPIGTLWWSHGSLSSSGCGHVALPCRDPTSLPLLRAYPRRPGGLWLSPRSGVFPAAQKLGHEAPPFRACLFYRISEMPPR